MRKTRWIAALLALWLGTNSAWVMAAKPPDLPANNPVRCEETEPGPQRVTPDDPVPAGETNVPVSIDTWCPQALPLLAQRICQHILAIMQPTSADLGAAPTPARDAATDDAVRSAMDPRFAATAQKARHLYELATRCARAGKLAEARAHLREAHLANPTCRFGRLAIERLQELEALPSDEEPQSDDAEAREAERAFQRMRATTQPLGMVQPRTF